MLNHSSHNSFESLLNLGNKQNLIKNTLTIKEMLVRMEVYFLFFQASVFIQVGNPKLFSLSTLMFLKIEHLFKFDFK
jgi:hypothetical protein